MVYEKNAFSTPFLRGYKVLKIPMVNPDGTSAWPELFPLSRIEELRQTVGARHFASQMMLESAPLERARLDPGGIKFYDTEFDPHTARIGEFNITGMTLYWDPSTGRRHRDGSACVLLYRDDKTRHLFIHDILYLTVSDEEIFPRRCCYGDCSQLRPHDVRLHHPDGLRSGELLDLCRKACAEVRRGSGQGHPQAPSGQSPSGRSQEQESVHLRRKRGGLNRKGAAT